MSLQAGIVGLPNVGKSTLFNALLSRQVADAQNYPFCTIDPNTGVVEVPDGRLAKLAEIVKTDRIVPAAMEFVDIAGLVEGAHKGEGLGNQFLSNIREVDLIIYVLRDFEDENIIRAGSQNPHHDFQILSTELQLADLSVLEKQKEPKGNATKEEKIRWAAVEKIRPLLEQGKPARLAELDDDQQKEVKSFGLLTRKPVMIVLNVEENAVANEAGGVSLELPDFKEEISVIRLCAKLEAQMTDLSTTERQELLAVYGIEEPILNRLIKLAYQKLGLITFLTAGTKEVRAWPISNATKAPQAAGTIHTDFEKSFIKAKIADYDDFVEANGWSGLKDVGKIRLEGKEYVMQEGDIVEFMVNV